MDKTTFMIIDNYTFLREAISLFLHQKKNFSVIAQCGDGMHAIDLAREYRPDIIFLDINIPSMNGFDLMKSIRKNSPCSKIVGFSVHSQPIYAKKMIRHGASAYLTKNTSMNEIDEAIDEVLNGKIYLCREVKDILSMQVLNDQEDMPDINSLSDRESQITKLLKEGCSSKEIAVTLNISCNTVEVHRSNILKKLKLKNTVSLISYINSVTFEI